MNNYRYELGEDPDNPCIMIPRYKALGRVAPNGKRYPDKPISRQDEDDLVPVRSIITKVKNKDIVTPDLIGTKFKDITPGTGIGLSFGSSLTESITQGALALKHGGHERVIDESGYLRAPKACKVRESGNWLILESRGGDLKYPRPENIVLIGGQTQFKAGDIICTAYNTTSPIIKLNSLIKLMRAKGSDGTRYFEKENVIVSDCYAYESGKISYIEADDGEIEIQIGNHRYDYNPQCMYYFPDGAEVKKLQRICSGIVNMNHVVAELGNNIQDIYLIFRKQFYSLMDSGFLKNGYTDLHSTQEELIEMLFISLSKVNIDQKTLLIDSVEYSGTNSGIMNNDSFYTLLSYGYSKRVISKALKGVAVMKDDIMTETVLGLLLNNQLDDNVQ